MAKSTTAYTWSGTTWDSTLRETPFLGWLAKYTETYDTNPKFAGWHTDDFTLVKADGEVVTGGEKAFEATLAVYGPFAKWRHQPSYAMVVETSSGYEMLGEAYVYANLVGEASQGESKVTDPEGKEWDVKVPGAFHFTAVGHGDAIKLKQTKLFSDSFPVIQVLMKRGVLKG